MRAGRTSRKFIRNNRFGYKKGMVIVAAIFVLILMMLAIAYIGIVVYEMKQAEKEEAKELAEKTNLKFDEVTEIEIPVDNKTLNSYKTTHLEIDPDMPVEVDLKFSMINNDMVKNNLITVDAYLYDNRINYSEDYVVVSCLNLNENNSSDEEFYTPILFVTEVNGVKQYRYGEDEDLIGVPANTFLKIKEEQIDDNIYRFRFSGEYDSEYRLAASCTSAKNSCKKLSKSNDDVIIVKVSNSLKGILPEDLY